MSIPPPDIRDFPYGPHPCNVLDLWLAEGDGPTPLFVWFHGGGFIGGDKTAISPGQLTATLENGISFASVNYRFSQQAPFPAAYVDGGRAIQMLRFMREAWRVDPQRIVAGGSSAGGVLSLWLGYHSSLADPFSNDPIAHESTQPNALACIATQSTLDPNVMRELIPGTAYLHIAMQLFFQVQPDEFQTARARALFAAGSPITHVTPDAPPTLMFYDLPNLPLNDELTQNHGIHHVKFGEYLKEKLDALGVPNVLKYREDYPDAAQETLYDVYGREVAAFMQQHVMERVC